jgi:hypothetical protein
MSAIRCPNCKLIHAENVRRCRRCGTLLSSKTVRKASSKSSVAKRAFYSVAISAIAILLTAFIYGSHRHLPSASDSESKPAAIIKGIDKIVPINRELEEVIRQNRDFMARLDQNATNHSGDGLNKNQILAFDTMMRLKEQQNQITDPEAQDYLNEFYRLVEKYYDELVRYNSESAHLAEVRQRIQVERNLVLKDSSLSPELKSSKLTDLWNQNVEESKSTTVSAADLDETVKFLRRL